MTRTPPKAADRVASRPRLLDPAAAGAARRITQRERVIASLLRCPAGK
jgi:hypothetical protein